AAPAPAVTYRRRDRRPADRCLNPNPPLLVGKMRSGRGGRGDRKAPVVDDTLRHGTKTADYRQHEAVSRPDRSVQPQPVRSTLAREGGLFGPQGDRASINFRALYQLIRA